MLLRKLHFTLLFSLSSLLFIAGCSKSDSGGLANSENYKSVGASANDLLSAARYTSVVMEIQYMPGYQPDAASVNNLVAFMNLLINKPGGISVILTQIPSTGSTTLTLTDITNIEKTYRTVFTSGSQIGIYFLYTDGVYSTANVLGLAFRNTSMCLLGKTIHDNSGSLGQVSRTKLESLILEHEMGHILGLVDLGSPMQMNHKDAAHGNHCNNANCLMYYGSQTTDITGPLINLPVPPLDANCKADLTANGGR